MVAELAKAGFAADRIVLASYAAAEIARLRQTEAALSANLADDGRTIEALEAALRPFARADLTSPGVRDTFGFDVLRARAALEKKP